MSEFLEDTEHNFIFCIKKRRLTSDVYQDSLPIMDFVILSLCFGQDVFQAIYSDYPPQPTLPLISLAYNLILELTSPVLRFILIINAIEFRKNWRKGMMTRKESVYYIYFYCRFIGYFLLLCNQGIFTVQLIINSSDAMKSYVDTDFDAMKRFWVSFILMCFGVFEIVFCFLTMIIHTRPLYSAWFKLNEKMTNIFLKA